MGFGAVNFGWFVVELLFRSRCLSSLFSLGSICLLLLVDFWSLFGFAPPPIWWSNSYFLLPRSAISLDDSMICGSFVVGGLGGLQMRPFAMIWFCKPERVSMCQTFAGNSFMPTALLRGCWYVDLITILAGDPFANFGPLLVSTNVHSSSFFVTWFRTRTRVR
ncbi:transmembrane protein, putative [Medicago truncatula]|uniref:Transmembrane protein, putative n=1 Tax=Medicago truncatula TaxID=3880 RepID=G7KDV0_MEDTR|nr:transmembrane protein, putative [Medicago truncatula]